MLCAFRRSDSAARLLYTILLFRSTITNPERGIGLGGATTTGGTLVDWHT